MSSRHATVLNGHAQSGTTGVRQSPVSQYSVQPRPQPNPPRKTGPTAGHDPSSEYELRRGATEASLRAAEKAMDELQRTIPEEPNEKDRKKLMARASNLIRIMLDPAAKAADLLVNMSSMVPACGPAGAALKVLVTAERERRDADARIVALYPDMACCVLVIGIISPTWAQNEELLEPVEDKIKGLQKLFGEFNAFCAAYYQRDQPRDPAAKFFKTLVHLIRSGNDLEKINEFRDKFNQYRQDLQYIINAQAMAQTVTIQDHTAQIMEQLDTLSEQVNSAVGAINGIQSDLEDEAQAFIDDNEGLEAVQGDDDLLTEFARKFGGPQLQISARLLTALKTSTNDIVNRTAALFDAKFKDAVTRIQSSMGQTRDAIIAELKEGPYQRITDEDLKTIWKDTAEKVSNIKRRQLTDAISDQYGQKYKAFEASHNTPQKDAWTLELLSKVRYHSAIGDAIDSDSSGFVSVDKLNEFLARKPRNWLASEWLAYWASGWDQDNYEYQDVISKALNELKRRAGDAKGLAANSAELSANLTAIQTEVPVFCTGCLPPPALTPTAADQMDGLRAEWKKQLLGRIKPILSSWKFQIPDPSYIPVLTGLDRLELAFLPLMSLLLSKLVTLMRTPGSDQQALLLLSGSILNLIDAFRSRILELCDTWSRQRLDIGTQVTYFANGLFMKYYQAERAQLEEEQRGRSTPSDWDSDDDSDWDGDRDVQDSNEADGGPGQAPQSQDQSDQAGDYSTANIGQASYTQRSARSGLSNTSRSSAAPPANPSGNPPDDDDPDDSTAGQYTKDPDDNDQRGEQNDDDDDETAYAPSQSSTGKQYGQRTMAAYSDDNARGRYSQTTRNSYTSDYDDNAEPQSREDADDDQTAWNNNAGNQYGDQDNDGETAQNGSDADDDS